MALGRDSSGDGMTAVDFENFVAELATVAGEAIMPFFRTAVRAHDKGVPGSFDPVTEADRAAETAMRHRILTTFPAHGIIGEEFDDHQPEAEYVWVLDPIDGTKSFISGFPTWGTLVALEHHGVPVYGTMHQPFTRERFFGDGARATWSGLNSHGTAISHHLRCRPCASIAEATVMTTSPMLLGDAGARKLRTASPTKPSCCGSAVTVTAIACWPRAMSTSSSRAASNPTTSRP